jgi:hypothetical protein
VREDRKGTCFTHGAQESLHRTVCRPAYRRGLQKDGAEDDGGRVGELEGESGLDEGKSEVRWNVQCSIKPNISVRCNKHEKKRYGLRPRTRIQKVECRRSLR